MTSPAPIPVPIVQKFNFGHSSLPYTQPRVSDSRFQPSFDDLSSSPVEEAPQSPRSHWSGSPRSESDGILPASRAALPASAPATAFGFPTGQIGTPLSHPVTINYGQYQPATSQIRGGMTEIEGSSPRAVDLSWRSTYASHNPKGDDVYRSHPSGMNFVPVPSKGWAELKALPALPFANPPPSATSFSSSSLDSTSASATFTGDASYHSGYEVASSAPSGHRHSGLQYSTPDQLYTRLQSTTEHLPMPYTPNQTYGQQMQGYNNLPPGGFSRDVPPTPSSASYPQYASAPNGYSAPYPQPPPIGQHWSHGGEDLFAVDETGVSLDDKGKSDKKEPRTVRRHICPICDKRFNRPSSLNTHMSVHTGAKPYQCPRSDCARRFSVSSNLRRHMRTHDARNAKDQGSDRTSHMSPVDASSSDEGQQYPHYVPPHMQASSYPSQHTPNAPYGFSSSYPPPGPYPTPQLYTPTPAFADMHLSNSEASTPTAYQLATKSPSADTKASGQYTPKPQHAQAAGEDKAVPQNASFYSPITFAHP